MPEYRICYITPQCLPGEMVQTINSLSRGQDHVAPRGRDRRSILGDLRIRGEA
jgi:hypothetical protein